MIVNHHCFKNCKAITVNMWMTAPFFYAPIFLNMMCYGVYWYQYICLVTLSPMTWKCCQQFLWNLSELHVFLSFEVRSLTIFYKFPFFLSDGTLFIWKWADFLFSDYIQKPLQQCQWYFGELFFFYINVSSYSMLVNFHHYDLQ